MFGLFKKKEAPKAEPKAEQAAEPNHGIAEAYGPFAAETLELSAVTGPFTFAVPNEEAEKRPEGPWCALLPLTAWYENEDPVVQGNAKLVAVADARLLAHLRRMAPRDAMIQVKARKSEQENVYLMTALPEPVMDPELKAILLKQVQPVVTEVEGLGEFTLERSSGVYRGDVEWLEEEIQLTFQKGSEEEMAAIQASARTLVENAQNWTDRALEAAGQQWDEEDGPLTLLAIDLAADGTFAFWLGSDVDPEAVCLQGSLDEGFVPPEA